MKRAFQFIFGKAMSGRCYVTYTTGFTSPSSCVWVVPNTMNEFYNQDFK